MPLLLRPLLASARCLPPWLLPLCSRWALVAAQACTLWITHALWITRGSEEIPAARRFPTGDWDAFPFLIASLALVVLPDLARAVGRPLPRWALPAAIFFHLGVLVAAIAQDELRLQPQVVVPGLLLLATLPGVNARTFGQGLLASMWLWAGAHKLLSDRFVEVFGAGVVARLFPNLQPAGLEFVCLAIAAIELALGLAVLALPYSRWKLLRGAMVLAGLGLHVGIVYSLHELAHNESVWPWNLAVAFCTVGLIGQGESFLSGVRRAPWLLRGALAVLLLVPAGFYLGLTHPYLAFVLYAGNAPRAHVRLPSGKEVPLRYVNQLRSFIPPTQRNFEVVFQSLCRPGHSLIITDDRTWARRNGRATLVVHCGEEGSP